MFVFTDHIFNNFLNTKKLCKIDRENNPVVKLPQECDLGTTLKR